MNLDALKNFQQDEEFDAQVVKEESRTGIRPGVHSITFTKCEPQISQGDNSNAAKGDPTWFKYFLSYQTAEGGKGKFFTMIPTAKATYGEKGSNLIWRNLRNLFQGIGVELSTANAAEVIGKYFGNDGLAWEGQTADAKFSYGAGHKLKKVSDGQYSIVTCNDENNESEVVAEGPFTVDEAKAYAITNEIKLSDGIKIKYFLASSDGVVVSSNAEETEI